MGLAHWDEIEVESWPDPPFRQRYQDLGTAAGSVEVGVGRWMPEAGMQTTPVHAEGGEEEIHYVLAGSGWSWQGGATYEIRAGDAIVHRIDEEPHTVVAGDDGIDVLAFGERASRGAHTWLPRAGVVRIQSTWVQALGEPHPWEREAEAGRVELGDPQPRPSSIVALDDVAVREGLRGRPGTRWRDLGRAAGSTRTGIQHVEVEAGNEMTPPHAHSAEEELYVVLGGGGAVLLDEEQHEVSVGSVVALPAGTGVAHTFRAGDDGLTVLAYGQRDPRDCTWYPRSRKLAIRAFKLRVRIDESLDYWDGEPSRPPAAR